MSRTSAHVEGGESETWQMNSYMYQDKHASIHVHDTCKTILEKMGNEHSSIVEQLSGYTVCSQGSDYKINTTTTILGRFLQSITFHSTLTMLFLVNSLSE